MSPMTIELLRKRVDFLNAFALTPLQPYTEDGKPNVGNYHLYGAYGKWSLHQMCASGGTRDVLGGLCSKRELANRISWFRAGLEAGRSQAVTVITADGVSAGRIQDGLAVIGGAI